MKVLFSMFWKFTFHVFSSYTLGKVLFLWLNLVLHVYFFPGPHSLCVRGKEFQSRQTRTGYEFSPALPPRLGPHSYTAGSWITPAGNRVYTGEGPLAPYCRTATLVPVDWEDTLKPSNTVYRSFAVFRTAVFRTETSSWCHNIV